MSSGRILQLQNEINQASVVVRDMGHELRTAARQWRRQRDAQVMLPVTAELLLLARVALQLEDSPEVLVLAIRSMWRDCRTCAGVSYNHILRLVTEEASSLEGQLQATAALAARGGARLRERVGRAIAEARTAMWLVQANTRGVAVSSVQLVAKLRAFWPVLARTWRSDRFILRTRSVARRRKAFVHAFRGRWGICWRRLPARPDVPPQELHSRVRPGGKNLNQNGPPLLGTSLGPRNGHPLSWNNLGSPQIWDQFGFQKWNPFCIFLPAGGTNLLHVVALALHSRPGPRPVRRCESRRDRAPHGHSTSSRQCGRIATWRPARIAF
jgi:hypothetical protein